MSEIFSKILKDKNGNAVNVGSKYQQPEWGAEKGAFVCLPETVVTVEDDEGSLATPFTNVPEVGKTYTVNWKGTEYVCDCQKFDMDGITCPMLGNGTDYGLIGNDEPFAIIVVPLDMAEAMGGIYAIIAPLDGSTGSVTLSIMGEAIHAIPAKYIESAMRVTVDANTKADKTYEEICAAIEAGRFVYVFFQVYENQKLYAVYMLSSYVPDEGVQFNSTSMNLKLVFKPDGTIEAGTDI